MYIPEIIAATNPHAAGAICSKYGYDCYTQEQLVNAMENISNDYGEEAVKEFLNLHPHKDLILEVFRRGNCPECRQLNKGLIQTNTGYAADGTVSSTAPSQQAAAHQSLMQKAEDNKLFIMAMLIFGTLALFKFNSNN
jgi:hypothetical protein